MSGRLAGGVQVWLPGLRTVREYQRSWLGSDLVAGLVLTARLPTPPSSTGTKAP
jgi:hypothetical protein